MTAPERADEPESASAPAARRRAWLACLLIASVTAFAGLGAHSPWMPDEPRVAGIGRAMLDSGDLVVPRLNGKPFLEKPPLYWWVQVAALETLGVSDESARLPSALFSLAALLVTAALGMRLGGPRAGVFAAAALAATAQYVSVTHRILVDAALVAPVALAQLGFLHWWLPRSPGERRRGALLLVCAVPLSFLAKGVIGPVLALGPPVLLLLAGRRWRTLGAAWPLALALLGSTALLVGGWLLLLWRSSVEGPALVHEVVVNQTLGRILGADEVGSHPEPPWFYLAKPGLFAPWVLALPALLAAGAARRADGRAAVRTLLLLLAFGVLLLSLPSGKRGLYVLPLLPALAALTGWWLAGVRAGVASGARVAPAVALVTPATPAGAMARDPRRFDRPTLLVLLGLLALLPWALLLSWGWIARDGGDTHVAAELAAVLALFGRGPWVPLAVVALGVLLTTVLVRHLRRSTCPAPAWVLAPLVALLLANEAGVAPLLEAQRSLRPLTAAVTRLLPGDGPVPVWRPSESLIGMFAYELGRPVQGLWNEQALTEHLDASPHALVLYAADRVASLPAELRAELVPRFETALPHDDPWVVAARR